MRCKWYDAEALLNEREDADGTGLCTWPASRLPESLKPANRERMSMSARAGMGCPCFEAYEAVVDIPKSMIGDYSDLQGWIAEQKLSCRLMVSKNTVRLIFTSDADAIYFKLGWMGKSD